MSEINVSPYGSAVGTALVSLLMCDDIQPGSQLGYETAKTIYLYHPLGRKMAEAPITMAQSQARVVTVQESPDEVAEAFEAKWKEIGADKRIHNLMRLTRVYGVSTIFAGSKQTKSNEPLDMQKIWEQELYFNVLDPLNTAGSLVLNQDPTSPDFQKPVAISTNGQTCHPSRCVVMMNEEPIYISYTASGYGFVGRSVYLRALFALKSFVRSMIADDMILTKLGLLIAKQKSPGSVITKPMQLFAAMKRNLLKEAQTGNVLGITIEESIETLNMQNVEGAGSYARGNCLKNVATAADMPAVIIENETMVAGFGEGTEDAKNIAAYIDSIRIEMDPPYRFFDNIVQYCAWNPEFYKRIQAKYKDYKDVSFEDAFSRWRQNFSAKWPSVLREPESEQEKSEKVKLEAVISVLVTLLDKVDPDNQARLMQAALDNISENKLMFPHEFTLDMDGLRDYLEQRKERQEKQEDAAEPAFG